jgi:hypothetical protein
MFLALCLLLQQGPVLTVQPSEGAIGQPLEVVLELDHALGAGLLKGGPALALDASWIVLEGPEVIALPGSGGTHTRVRWSVISLESGARSLPGLNLVLADGASLTVEGAALSIDAELGAEEDSPRPLPTPQGVAERAGPLRLAHVGWMLCALLLAVAWGFWLRKRKGQASEAHAQGEWARFIVLREFATTAGKGAAHESGRAQDVSAELAALLRSAAQHRVGALRPGQADGEWLELMRNEGEVALADELTPLLDKCEQIRFGGLRPTRFALDELLQSSADVLAHLAPDAPSPEEAVA